MYNKKIEQFIKDLFKINVDEYKDIINIETLKYAIDKLVYQKFYFEDLSVSKYRKFFSLTIEKDFFKIEMIKNKRKKFSLICSMESKIKIKIYHSSDLPIIMKLKKSIFCGVFLDWDIVKSITKNKEHSEFEEYIEYDTDNITYENYIIYDSKKYMIQETLYFCDDELSKRTTYNELLEEQLTCFFWLKGSEEGFSIDYDYNNKTYTGNNRYFPSRFLDISSIVIKYLNEFDKKLEDMNNEDIDLAKMICYS